MKLKEFGPPGAHVPRGPPLGSATGEDTHRLSCNVVTVLWKRSFIVDDDAVQ